MGIFVKTGRASYVGQKGVVQTDRPSRQFDINRGTKQGDPIKLDCHITNPSTITLDCNRVYLAFLRSILVGRKPEFKCETKEVEQVIATAMDSTKPRDCATRDCATNRGWCLHGLWCAVRCYYQFDSYQDAMDWVINLPGKTDTDTNAAIAGAVMGAKIGYDKMLAEERTGPNMCMVFKADIEKSDIPRPLKYHPRNIPFLMGKVLARQSE